MTENFTSIKYYIRRWYSEAGTYYFGAWQEVTADVLETPRPRGSVGFRSNELTDRLADGGEMTIALKNTTGTYTGSLTDGAMRMVCTWDGVSVVKFEGFCKPNSKKINIDPLVEPYIEVTYQDWLSWAMSYQLDNIEYKTGMRIDQAVTYILEQMEQHIIDTSNFMVTTPGLDPEDYILFTPQKSFDEGYYTFPDVFDIQNKTTTIGGEFRRLVESELGYIYQRGGMYNSDDYWNSSLVIENRTHRKFSPSGDGTDTLYPTYSGDHDGDRPLLSDGSSFPLLSDGTSFPLLTDTAAIELNLVDLTGGSNNIFRRYDHIYNFVRIKTRPRRVDAAATTVLWTMENSTMVAAGETITGLRGSYRDPSGGASYINCIELTPPTATTDYKAYENEDGTGADLTANLIVMANMLPSEVEITLTNTGATDLYTGGDVLFQVRGRGVYQYDSTDLTRSLVDASDAYIADKVFPIGGRRELSMDLYYKDDPNDIIEVIDNKAYWRGYPTYCANSIELLANRNTKTMRLWMYGDVGSNFNLDVDSATIAYDSDVYINGYSFEVIDNKLIKWIIIPFEEERAIRTTP